MRELILDYQDNIFEYCGAFIVFYGDVVFNYNHTQFYFFDIYYMNGYQLYLELINRFAKWNSMVRLIFLSIYIGKQYGNMATVLRIHEMRLTDVLF